MAVFPQHFGSVFAGSLNRRVKGSEKIGPREPRSANSPAIFAASANDETRPVAQRLLEDRRHVPFSGESRSKAAELFKTFLLVFIGAIICIRMQNGARPATVPTAVCFRRWRSSRFVSNGVSLQNAIPAAKR